MTRRFSYQELMRGMSMPGMPQTHPFVQQQVTGPQQQLRPGGGVSLPPAGGGGGAMGGIGMQIQRYQPGSLVPGGGQSLGGAAGGAQQAQMPMHGGQPMMDNRMLTRFNELQAQGINPVTGQGGTVGGPGQTGAGGQLVAGGGSNGLVGGPGQTGAGGRMPSVGAGGVGTSGNPAGSGQAVAGPQPIGGNQIVGGPGQTGGGGRDPEALANYWRTHPGTLPNAIRQNPEAWGADPNNPATMMGGTPYNGDVPMTGLLGAEDGLRRGLSAAYQSQQNGVNAAGETVSPYTQGGSGAFNYQAALSGALGNQAQQDALSQYMESPGQQYLRDMGERAILRNAASTGGLGGGNVLQELQRHGIGLAAQDFNDSFNRLGQLSGMGHQSANMLGGIQANAGNQAGNWAYGTGQSLADGRTRAGELMADQMAGISAGMSSLMNQQGQGLSGLIGSSTNSLANLLSGYGSNDANMLMSLASLLGNSNTGAASQFAGLTPIGNTHALNQWDAMGDVGGVLSALGNLASAYPGGGGGGGFGGGQGLGGGSTYL